MIKRKMRNLGIERANETNEGLPLDPLPKRNVVQEVGSERGKSPQRVRRRRGEGARIETEVLSVAGEAARGTLSQWI